METKYCHWCPIDPFVGEIGRVVYKRVTLQFINTVHEDIYRKSAVYQITLDIFTV